MPPKKILAIGEILWDLLPTGPKLGGAPANFAYHARSLGADAGLVTRVGDDLLGREARSLLDQLGLPTDCVQVDPMRPTGTVAVTLGPDQVAAYSFPPDVAWDAIEPEELALARAAEADAVCFGTLAQRSAVSRHSIRRLVEATPANALRIFDVNLRQDFYDRDVIEQSLRLATALKLNEDEWPVLATLFGLSAESLQSSVEALASRFELSLVALTRGSQGSLIWADGVWSERGPGARIEVVDTVGAGDAFTAALVVSRLAGRPLDAIHRHAAAVASFVCTQAGATPTLPDHLARWTD
jgi:fructokinase